MRRSYGFTVPRPKGLSTLFRIGILWLIFCSTALWGHRIGENYLKLHYDENNRSLRVTLEVETRVWERSDPTLDGNGNGIVSYRELRGHFDRLVADVAAHVRLYEGERALDWDGSRLTLHRYQGQTYLAIVKSFTPVDFERLHLRYTLFFDKERGHKLLVHAEGERGDIVLDARHRELFFRQFSKSLWERFKIFVREGFAHILDGTDHLLFVLMILLPSVHRGLSRSWPSLLKIVTLFTVAHSITLFLAGMGWVRPDPFWIESGIALSIFVVAVMNFIGAYGHVNGMIVFLFGLLHGFGFANVLEIGGITRTVPFLVSLFGFNVGVELGQIFVILLYLPFLYLIGAASWRERGLRVTAGLAALVSAYWFFQRVGLIG